jgi:SAM-dependent methyltransferase
VMTLLEYIEHESDPRAVLSEARRVIRGGGHLAIEIPHPSGFVARTFGRYWWNLDVPRHLIFFDPDTLRKQLASCGFELLSVKPFTLPLYIGASVLQALGQRHWNKNKRWVPLVAGLLGLPFLPFQPLLPEFLFTVAKAK